MFWSTIYSFRKMELSIWNRWDMNADTSSCYRNSWRKSSPVLSFDRTSRNIAMMDETDWFSTFIDCSILNEEVRIDLVSGAVDCDWISTTADAATVDGSGELSVSLVGDKFLVWSASENWSAEDISMFQVVVCCRILLDVRGTMFWCWFYVSSFWLIVTDALCLL